MKVPKQVMSLRLWLVFAILLNVVITVYSAAIEPPEEPTHRNHDHHEHHEDHVHDHHDHSVEHDHGDSAEPAEISIKGHGEDCSGEGVKCNEKDGLSCFRDLGKCECSVGSVFSTASGKCEEAPPKPIHDTSNELTEEHENDDSEPESVTTTSALTSHKDEPMQVLGGNHDMHEKDHDHGHDHDAVDGHAVANKCENVDCVKDLGKYSKCDEATGKCICTDIDKHSRTLELINGTCWIQRKINDPCASHEECSATIKGRAWCHMDIETMNRFCQCEMFHYFDETLRECLPFAEDGLFSACKTDFQCTGFDSTPSGHGLGPNSRCSPDSGVCECKLGHNGEKGFLYENYCFYHLKVGDPCKFDRECQVTDQNTVCSEETKTCSLKANPVDMNGRLIADDGQAEAASSSEDEGLINSLKSAMGIQMSNFVFILIILAVVAVVVLVIALFVVKKRHKYAVVRTRDTSDPNHM